MFEQIWAADSGDLVSAIYNSGSIHPPGFPLYYLLAKLFTLIPIGSPAQKIATISLIFSLAIMLITYWLIKYVVRFLKIKVNYWILVATQVLYFFNHINLIYSLTPEIYTLSSFIIILNSWFLIRFLNKQRTQDHLFFWLTFFIGLFFHYVILLSLLAYIWFQRNNLNRIKLFFRLYYRKLLLFFFIGFSPYLIFYLLWNSQSLIFWEPKNLVGWWRLLTRAQYGFFSTSLNSYQPFLDKFSNWFFYLSSLINSYTWFGLIVILAGLFYCFKQNSKLTNLILLLLILYGPVFVFYTDVNLDSGFSRGVLERYFILSLPFLTVVIYFGLFYLSDLFISVFNSVIKSVWLKQWSVRFFSFLLLICFPFLFLSKNSFYIGLLSQNQYFKTHAYNLLGSIPKNSIVLLSGDLNLFPAQYYRYVLNYRTDLLIIPHSNLLHYEYLKVLKIYRPDLVLPKPNSKRLASSFIKLNLPRYRFFTNKFISNSNFKLTGFGLLDEISLRAKPREKLPDPKLDVSFLTDQLNIYPLHFLDELRQVYSQYYYYQALKSNKKQEVNILTEQFLQQAYQTNSNSHEIALMYGLVLTKKRKCEKAKEIFMADFSRTPTHETALALSNFYAVCFESKVDYLYWQKISEKLR